MPPAPPGIRQRAVYSELLVSTGLLFERRHKARQLADLAQLHLQAKCYLDRWVNSEQEAREVEVTLEDEGEQSPGISDAPGDDLNVGGPVIRSVASDAAYTSEDNWDGYHRTGTKVYLTKTNNLNYEATGYSLQSDFADTDCIDTPTQLAASSSVDSIVQVYSVATAASGDTVVSICGEENTIVGASAETHAAENKERYPNRTVAKIIWTCCFLTQIIVSAVIVTSLHLSNRWNWHEKFRSFHIVYPFVTYFSTRVIAQSAIDWALTRYVRSYNTPAKTDTRLELYHLINGAINNTCLVLAVAAASLPNIASEELIVYATETNAYFGIIAAILAINLIATVYQCCSKYRRLRDLSA